MAAPDSPAGAARAGSGPDGPAADGEAPPPAEANPLDMRGICFSYGAEPVLDAIDLKISAGEFVAIAGPNGGGKSTLLRLALGLLSPDSGEIAMFGSSPARLRERWRIGYVPQRPYTPVDFPATVREVVASGRWPRVGPVGKVRDADRVAISRVIEVVGLDTLSGRRLGELSGGQQQRVHLARALASNPELLLLDEPMGGVDVEAQTRFRDLLGHLRDEFELTVVLVAHEYGPLADLVERLVILAKTVRFDGPPPSHEAAVHEHHGLESEYLSLWGESQASSGGENGASPDPGTNS